MSEYSGNRHDESLGDFLGKAYPSTGGFSGPKKSKNKLQNQKHTKVPGLVPVNISGLYEFYLGIKTQDEKSKKLIYSGDRLQFDD